MKNVLVLAGSEKEASKVVREFKGYAGLSIRYVSSKSLLYLGLKDACYLKVGRWESAGYPSTMWAYFESHGFTDVTNTPYASLLQSI